MKASHSIEKSAPTFVNSKKSLLRKHDGFEMDYLNTSSGVTNGFQFDSRPVMKFIQPKLTINEPGDKYEMEADAMAEKVMRSESVQTSAVQPLVSSIQKKCAKCKEEEEEEKLQRKEMNTQPAISSNSLDSYVSNLGAGGQPLSKDTRNFYESRFGFDFSNVRIHQDSLAARSAQSINALAYTHANHIVFNSGQYAPQSNAGKRLLAHELTHVVQNQKYVIQREPMPEDAKVSDLESYSSKTRQNIRYDNDFNFQSNASLYFQKGIVMDVRKDYNVSFVVKGFDANESWIEPAMKALALYNFNLNGGTKEDAITNLTTVQHLDLTSQKKPDDDKINGPDILVRFTSAEFDTTGKGSAKQKNVQLLIEKMGAYSSKVSKEKAEDRKKRYESTYQITNAVPVRNDPLGDPPEAMDDAKFDMVLQALDIVPQGLLSQGKGIPIYRGLTAKGPEGEVAEYSQTKAKGSDVWERRITVYADFFSASLDTKAFIMAHEFGHALDFRPNEKEKGAGGPSLSAEKGKGSFKEAMALDGGLKKGISTYDLTQSEEKEYFAEAFTMYINQPKTLKALRPNVYKYFQTRYP